MLRILIADDYVVVRKGLKEILAEAATPSVVGEASNGIDALALALDGEWDIVLLDISMPGLAGLEVLRRVHNQHPQLPIIMFSMHAEPYYIHGALRLGAAGYVTKESAPDELLDAIHTVLGGGQYLCQRSLRALDDTLNSAHGASGH